MNMATRRAVFFDRDGVLNEPIVVDGKPYPPGSLTQLRLYSDALDALTALTDAGYLLIGVTNQPDVARGTQRRDVVEAINAEILASVPLIEIMTCFHDDSDNCECRKPKPGLLFDATSRHGLDLANSYLVGDRWKDIAAGNRAGCRTILIRRAYSQVENRSVPTYSAASLLDAASWILGRT